MNNDEIRSQLLAQKAELANRVDRIHQHARDPLEADSSEDLWSLTMNVGAGDSRPHFVNRDPFLAQARHKAPPIEEAGQFVCH